jgi:long-chain acyl-CoA synthetase
MFWTDMSEETSSSALWAAFHARTQGLGDRTAVSTATEEVTFEALWAEAERLVSAFAAAGVVEGAVAGLAARNSPRFLTALLALWRLDACLALLSPQYGPGELSAVVTGTGAAGVVTEAELAPGIAAAVRVSRSSAVDGLEVLIPTGAKEGPAQPAALLKFSSGSTAEPKGIALSAANVIAEVENVTRTLGLGEGDRILAGAPLFHSYGFDLGLLPTLYAGSTLTLEDVFISRRMLAALTDPRIAVFRDVPAQYRAFLATRVDAPPDLSGVRWLLSCTAPLAPEVVTSFSERFGVPIWQHYGSSETGAVTTHVPSEVERRPQSVGRAMAGVQVTVADPDGFRAAAGRRR